MRLHNNAKSLLHRRGANGLIDVLPEESRSRCPMRDLRFPRAMFP